MAKPKTESVIEINEIEMATIGFNVVFQTPLIMNRFNQKAWQELLFPSGQRNRADMEQSLKHDPVAEFRGAVYRNRDTNAPTLIHIPNGAFHGALAQAAVDIPGAARAKIERLTRITDVNINLYGVPKLFMAMVRNSDMNHTPDVRTRPIFPEAACTVTVSYVKQVLTERTIGNLFGAAGIIVGIGDWRGQKGGPYGSFRLCDSTDKEFKRIVRTGGRAAQEAAMANPAPYDDDSAELMDWFNAEIVRRERHLPSNPLSAKPKRTVTVHTNGKGSENEQFVGVEASDAPQPSA